MVLVYGVGWRAFRDQFGQVREWMANFEFFANEVCARWDLPLLPGRPRVEATTALECKRPKPRGHVLEGLPESHAANGPEADFSWGVAPIRLCLWWIANFFRES